MRARQKGRRKKRGRKGRLNVDYINAKLTRRGRCIGDRGGKSRSLAGTAPNLKLYFGKRFIRALHSLGSAADGLTENRDDGCREI